jgi:hypothetical protein
MNSPAYMCVLYTWMKGSLTREITLLAEQRRE